MEKLAILGGRKAVTSSQKGISDWPLYGKEEIKAVTRVLMSGYHCYDEMGPLEEELKRYFKVKYALSCVNGTAALHSGMFAAGVGPGDEVIVPSYSYWATCLCALCVNALPVFADIDPRTLNLDPADVERKITKRTKAIVALHMWGNPCDMDAIMRIARKNKLKVIEDAAHVHGATLHGRYLGTWGDVGCFSMQASKNLPALEGGFILTNNRDYYERCLALGHYGRLLNTRYKQYNNTCLGYKYRIHPLSAALARLQLRKLDGHNRERNRNIAAFCKRVRGLPGIEECASPKGAQRVFYGFRMLYRTEQLGGLPLDSFIAALQAEGASVAAERYSLKHQEPLFAAENVFDRKYPWNLGPQWRNPVTPKSALPETEGLLTNMIALPAFQKASAALLDQYARAFEKVCRQAASVPRVPKKKRGPVDGARAAIR